MPNLNNCLPRGYLMVPFLGPSFGLNLLESYPYRRFCRCLLPRAVAAVSGATYRRPSPSGASSVSFSSFQRCWGLRPPSHRVACRGWLRLLEVLGYGQTRCPSHGIVGIGATIGRGARGNWAAARVNPTTSDVVRVVHLRLCCSELRRRQPFLRAQTPRFSPVPGHCFLVSLVGWPVA